MKIRSLFGALVLSAVLAVACSGVEPVAVEQVSVATPQAEATATQAAPTSEPVVTPVAEVDESARWPRERTNQRVDWALDVAAYGPFNVDGQDGIGPFTFGPDDASQQAGFQCYVEQLDTLVDIDRLEQRASETEGYLALTPAENRGAMRAAANCMPAELYRARYIASKAWSWNEYGRDEATEPVLKVDDPCFAPVYHTPEAFVEALLADEIRAAEFGPSYIGPFDCL